MKKVVLSSLAAMGCACAFGAESAIVPEPVAVLEPATYSSEATAPDWIRQECHLERQVVDDLHAALAEAGLGGAVVQSAGDGLAVRLTIERVIGKRGGGWSGPKTLTLGVALLRSGHVERTTSQGVATKSLNPLAGTCESFERASSKVSVLITRWLKTPTGTAASASRPVPAASLSSH